MTEEIQSYLEQVMRHSGLSKREKAEWIQEMYAHLHDETTKLMECGHEENEAIMIALKKFGKPSELRRKIARETFGLSTATIYFLASLWLVLSFLGMYLVHLDFPWGRQEAWQPNTWVYLFTQILPLSPSLMLALCISCLLLFKTRCWVDRAGLGLTLGIFGVMWFLIRMQLPGSMDMLLFGFRNLTIMQPWISIISAVLVLWGLFLYIWTKNKWVSLSPTLLSIVVGLWAPILNEFQFGFLSAHQFIIRLSILVTVRCVPIIILLLVFRLVNKYSVRRRSLTTS